LGQSIGMTSTRKGNTYMSFTLPQIEEIFDKNNFAVLVRDLKRLGVLSYEYNLQIGEYTFYGADGHQEVMKSNGLELVPVEKTDTVAIQQVVKKFQNHDLAFSEMAKELASLGIFSWETNLEKLSVEFFNHKGEVAYREVFASVFD